MAGAVATAGNGNVIYCSDGNERQNDVGKDPSGRNLADCSANFPILVNTHAPGTPIGQDEGSRGRRPQWSAEMRGENQAGTSIVSFG